MAGINEIVLRKVKRGDPISAREWNEFVRLLKRTITGPNVVETSTGWHIKGGGDDDPATLVVENTSGETAPEGGCIEIYDFDTDGGIFMFRKPTGDNLPNVYVLKQELDDGIIGLAYERGVTAPALFASPPAAQDIVGSQSGSWYWGVDSDGSHVAVADEWIGV